uniref:Uncharacterized protein n=1 Tax=viral metagenome TaxID=1070528 RepID=A0A6C0EXV5_9ZZZZ
MSLTKKNIKGIANTIIKNTTTKNNTIKSNDTTIKNDTIKKSTSIKKHELINVNNIVKTSGKTISKNLIKMLSNITKFKEFYKKLSKADKEILNFYKAATSGVGYIHINKYLYNNTLDDLDLNDIIDYYNINKNKLFTNNTQNLFDINRIDMTKISKFVEYYINKNIVNNINNIDKLFMNKNIPKIDGINVLYRGTKGDTQTSKKSKIGDEIIFKNFLSTSTKMDNATSFSNNFFNKKFKIKYNCCIYILYNVKNIPFIYLPWNITQNKSLDNFKINMVSGDEFEYLLPRNLKFKIINITYDVKPSEYDFNKLRFKDFGKFVDKKHIKKDINNHRNINNNDYDLIKEKIFKKIKIYHLEFIEQLPITEMPQYVYSNKINLHINKPYENTTLDK